MTLAWSRRPSARWTRKAAVAVANFDAIGEHAAVHLAVIEAINFARVMLGRHRHFEAKQRLVLEREIPLGGNGRVLTCQDFGIDAHVVVAFRLGSSGRQ